MIRRLNPRAGAGVSYSSPALQAMHQVAMAFALPTPALARLAAELDTHYPDLKELSAAALIGHVRHAFATALQQELSA